MSGVHVGELGLAAFRRHDLRIHHRRLAGALAPRAVGMPKERAPVGMLAARLAVLSQVREHVDLGEVLVAVILVHQVDPHQSKGAANSSPPKAPRHADHNGKYTTHVSVTVTSDAGYQ